ncbi:MAG: methyl-accepting chemotaxis protein [Myxococcales bacterium]|jgi:methyl-accepting chemotaxis protein
MRLGIQHKVGGFLAVVLLLAFAATTAISTQRSGRVLERYSAATRESLREAAFEQAQQVFRSLEAGTQGTVERGEMDDFQSLLEDLGKVPGVLEIGATDPEGKVAYSSKEAADEEQLAADAFELAVKRPANAQVVERADHLLLVQAKPLQERCLRCHGDAAVGDVAGVLFARYSLDSLREADTTARAFLGEAKTETAAAGIVAGLGGLAAATLGIWLLLGVLVRRPLVELSGHLHKIASGDADLTVRLPVRSSDEVSDVARGFNAFLENLQALVAEVLRNARAVSAGTAQILAVCHKVQEGAAQQTGGTSAAASASQEMSNIVGQIAGNSQDAADAAQLALEKARAGGEVVDLGIDEMRKVAGCVAAIAERVSSLSERSVAINGIMELIEDIARQTNVLALNASIEAARAGGGGSGFAVIAHEIRKLADRTAESAKEVKRIVIKISEETRLALDSVTAGLAEVERSSELSQRAGDALREIVERISGNSTLVSLVASGTRQQNEAISDIALNIESIARLARDLAENSEQASSISRNLGAETERLMALAGRFRV